MQVTRMFQRYMEPHRKYHTLLHIAEMLDGFAAAMEAMPKLRGYPHYRKAIKLAIWYHDAVYDPLASDNEERSAALACEELHGFEEPGVVVFVSSLVLSTKSHDPHSPGEELLSDLDMGILGAGTERYAEYAQQVQDEYLGAGVTWAQWCVGRSDFLLKTSAAEQIFYTPFYRKREDQARVNMTTELANLINKNDKR